MRLDADFAGYADLIRRDLQDFNFDLDADFAGYADLLAGLAYLPGAFFGASTT